MCEDDVECDRCQQRYDDVEVGDVRVVVLFDDREDQFCERGCEQSGVYVVDVACVFGVWWDLQCCDAQCQCHDGEWDAVEEHLVLVCVFGDCAVDQWFQY